MFKLTRDTQSTTIGVVGPTSVTDALRDVRTDIDADASLEQLEDTDDDNLNDVDCVIVVAPADSMDATGSMLASDDIIELVTEVEYNEADLPVLVLTPPKKQVPEVLQYEFVDYLPLSAIEETPVAVLRRAVDSTYKPRVTDYGTIYDSISEPVTLHNPDTGEVIHANQQLCELLGYDRSELVAMEVGEYTADIDGYDQAAAMEVITSATASGTVGPVEWPLETKTGEQVWVEATLTPVEVGGKEVILSTSTDVTDRRQQRRQLKEITEHIEEVVYLARADLSEVLFVNDAYAELFGQPVERIYEDPFAVLDAVHPEDRAGYRADLKAMSEHVQTTGDPYEFSQRLRVNGETRWVEVTGTPSRGPHGTVDRIVGVIRDVTETRQREREYEQIFHGVNDAIAVHDTETGEIVDVNESYTDLYGYDRETILETDMGQLSVPEEDYTDGRAKKLITGVAESGDDETVEWQIETADGERRSIESNLTLATVGGEQCVLSIIRDITERKRREREYEQIFHGVSEGVAVHDPTTGEIVDVNETMCELTGYSREVILDKGAEHILVDHPDTDYPPGAIPEVIDQVMNGNRISPYTQVIETADNEHRWIEVNPTQVVIGGEDRFLALSRDITERKQREQELEQIFNGVTDIIGVYHPETAELLDINETMCDLLGYDRETIIEADPAEITATELGFDAETIREVIREVATTNEPIIELEWALRTASGDTLWIEVNATPAEINGQRRVLTIARDVTGRRDREERVEVLSRVLRHNFRNDIDVLRAYADGIEEIVDHKQVHEYVDQIRKTADGFLELSEKARTAEQILQNDTNQETQAVGTVIRSVVSTAQNTYPEATFNVTCDASEAPVEADVFQLVIRELIENAIQHGGDAPSVSIATACNNDELTITIADNGSGIPNRVLTPFQPGGETQLQHNHGLGLWLVNWGVRRLGGGINFERPPDGGTAVRLHLPDHSNRTGL